MAEAVFKSGFVSIIGKPNAGKRTLLNALVGRKLSIMTPRAQTTRHRILGIAHGDNYQIVFSDTPGIILPQYKLHKVMMKSVHSSMEDADLIILLVDVAEKYPEDELFRTIEKRQCPVILVLNKIDTATVEDAARRAAEIKEKIPVVAALGVSALHGFNLPLLKELILENLEEGPPYFDPESLSDRPERFFITELIREKIFLHLHEEVPHSAEVSIAAYEESPQRVNIHADIHVERDSQKGIVIGKGGEMLKRIGTEARKDIEDFLDRPVFLKLFVKVTDGWKDNSFNLKGFGYE
jgi:GTP-binding protein Era